MPRKTPKIVISGKATNKVKNIKIPVKKIIMKAVDDHMKRLPFLSKYEVIIDVITTGVFLIVLIKISAALA